MDTPVPAFGKVLYNVRMILQPGQPYNSGVASDSMAATLQRNKQ
jgi:hypothetical protein